MDTSDFIATASAVIALLALFATIVTTIAQVQSRKRERRLDEWRAVNFRKLKSEPGELRVEHIGYDPAETAVVVWWAEGMPEDERDWQGLGTVVPWQIITLTPPDPSYSIATVSWEKPRTRSKNDHSRQFPIEHLDTGPQ
ncbi:hypothetical protein [Brevibacterium sp. UCMA 11752]|uniref:hypothetical protein n=1 Tax=Brevibacterium sp. UCMA 11752 TaxID=2745946 RepID=UPI001F40838B|nr:hypothetical protein [Brevibacterium sp. UCMA 11752]MCF2588939.1 hypothetical protein [Brevibacterium sp. UCMA 11752]